MKGRRILCPRGDRVRPVLGRLRESLFSLLGDLDGLFVLDLFSGVGSLGLESLSRGATFATFVERDGAALSYLRRNITNLELEEVARIHSRDVFEYLDGLERSDSNFDIVFADPQYGQGDIVRLMDRFTRIPWIASMIVIKHYVGEEPGNLWQGAKPLRVLKRGDDRITVLRGGERIETGNLSRNI